MQQPELCPICGTQVGSASAFCSACGHARGEHGDQEGAATTGHPAPSTSPGELVSAAGAGAVAALGAAAAAIAVLAAAFLGTVKPTIGLIGALLGAPLHVRLGDVGDDLGVLSFAGAIADAAGVTPFLDLPLTLGAAVPLAALVLGGWLAAHRLRPNVAAGASPLAIGGLTGGMFALLLMLGNVVVAGTFSSKPLPTLVAGTLWGTTCATIGAACHATAWRPVAMLRGLVEPAQRLPGLAGLPEAVTALLRALRSSAGVLGVYVIITMLAASVEHAPVAGLALLVLVVVATFGVALARRLGGTPQSSAIVLGVAVVAAFVVVSDGEMRSFALATLIFLPAMALAALYWAQGAAFEVNVSGDLGLLGGGEETVARAAWWSGHEGALGVSLFLIPVLIAVVWHLLCAGRAVARRQGAATPALVAASVAVPWTALMALLRPLASGSTGGSWMLGELSGSFGPGLGSTIVAAVVVATLASGAGVMWGARISATPRLVRWTERRTRTLVNLRDLAADALTLVRPERPRPGDDAPGSASSSVVEGLSASAPGADAHPAPTAPGIPPLRWRRAYTYALAGVIVLAVMGFAGNAYLQHRQDRAAAVDAARDALRDQTDEAWLFADALELDASSVRVREHDDVDLGDISNDHATATAHVVLEVTPDLPTRYIDGDPAVLVLDGTWTLRLVGDREARAWSLENLRPAGKLSRSPALREEPDEAAVDEARDVAAQALTAALTLDAEERPDDYTARQPDVYLTDPVADAESAGELVAASEDDGDESLDRHPPFLTVYESEDWFGDRVRELRGTAFEAARDLVFAETGWCGGDETLVEVVPKVGDWATDEIGAGPLGGLQHVALTASVTLEGVTRCVSSWDGKAKRQEGSATVSASVLLVRPQLEGLDRDWRIERLDLDDAAVYAPYPDGAYGAEQAFELG